MEMTVSRDLADFLLEKAALYETRDFIADDPIQMPHAFDDLVDIEVAGWYAATLAWGNRKSIIASCEELLFRRMSGAPGQFVREASAAEMEQAFAGFVHRTFQAEDAARTARSLRSMLTRYGSLEGAFLSRGPGDAFHMLGAFRDAFFADDPPGRTSKHVADPRKGSAAKRLNMYLRWMVRPATRGVDLGVWQRISPADLSIPLDVHTGTIGRQLGLFNRKANDWRAVEALMSALRQIDPVDPVRLDFALFGLGAIEKLGNRGEARGERGKAEG